MTLEFPARACRIELEVRDERKTETDPARAGLFRQARSGANGIVLLLSFTGGGAPAIRGSGEARRDGAERAGRKSLSGNLAGVTC